jgi:Tfp pilus assembly protein PilF
MKHVIIIFLGLISFTTFAQVPMNLDQWNKEALSNKRLQPKYGNLPKSDEEKQADEKFISSTLQMTEFNGDRTKASDKMIQLGFTYLTRGDVKTAMYRFNQGYLLDSNNTDIYWGYGAVYMTLGDYATGKKQYEEGLSINPSNTHLLTDLGTYYLGQFYILDRGIEKSSAQVHLDSAIVYLNKSYLLDAKDFNTTFKLSICYWKKGDCTNAWKFYDECAAIDKERIPSDYRDELTQKCKRKKK